MGYDLLANELIQTLQIQTEAEWRAAEVDYAIPLFDEPFEQQVHVIELPDDDAALMQISNEGILSLSLEEMRAIRGHYLEPAVQAHRAALELPAWPTDVELECIAQTWSEHCSHKIFAGQVDYTDEETGAQETIHSLYKTYVKPVPKRLPSQSTGWCRSLPIMQAWSNLMSS